MENQELRQQYENYCKELKQKITDLQLENERLKRENEQWKIYKEPKRDLEKQIAMLKDGLEYQKDMADTYAKALREVWDKLDCFADESISIEMKLKDLVALGDGKSFIISDVQEMYEKLKQLKNSIPETALKRGE